MTKVQITFDHALLKGTLEAEVSDEELTKLKEMQDSYNGFHLFANTQSTFYVELGDDILNTVTVKPLYTLPTEEGIYMDADGGVWRLNVAGNWLHLHAYDPPRIDPEHYMPFTQLKLGRTY